MTCGQLPPNHSPPHKAYSPTRYLCESLRRWHTASCQAPHMAGQPKADDARNFLVIQTLQRMHALDERWISKAFTVLYCIDSANRQAPKKPNQHECLLSYHDQSSAEAIAALARLFRDSILAFERKGTVPHDAQRGSRTIGASTVHQIAEDNSVSGPLAQGCPLLSRSRYDARHTNHLHFEILNGYSPHSTTFDVKRHHPTNVLAVCHSTNIKCRSTTTA